MASFDKKTESNYAQASVIQVLKPTESLRRLRSSSGTSYEFDDEDNVVEDENQEKSGHETWKVAFAPDESFFAWSCGNQYVVLIPFLQTFARKLSQHSSNPVIKSPDYEKRILDCCSSVHSVAFGSSTSTHKYESNNRCWNLHKFKDMILATGLQNGRIRIWDVYTGRLLLKLMDHSGLVRDVSFAPDGSLHLASASHDSTVKIWHMKDGGNMFKTLRGQNYMLSCSWSPDAKKLVSVGKNRIAYVWDMSTYKVILKLEGHLNCISSCNFSPDGTMIATASYDTKVIIWDAENGKILRKLGHLFPHPSLIYASGDNDNWVRSVSFSTDGCHIATVADDGYLRFWDLTESDEEDPTEITPIKKALCCSYSPSGRIIAVGTRNGSVNMVLSPMKIHSLQYLSRMAVRHLIFANKLSHEQLVNDLPKQFLKYILK